VQSGVPHGVEPHGVEWLLKEGVKGMMTGRFPEGGFALSGILALTKVLAMVLPFL